MLEDDIGGGGPTETILPSWIIIVSFYSSIISAMIVILSIILHLVNYRKPFQQRLMIRIQMIVPLFAISCYSMLINQSSVFNKYILEPIREVYEAFVIYTFFSLLTELLGGERNIIIMTSGRSPVRHPGIILGNCLPPMDISDSHTFLAIKRGILQYVWLKPIIIITTFLTQLLGWYNVNDLSFKSIYFWLTLFYNFSVSLSLYCLAMFWRILWNDLKPFKPVGKFLCVKLIIFASYWQGVILAILNFFQILGDSTSEGDDISIAVCIQNALLCVELIGFAWGHWVSFTYKPFTISELPYGRYKLKYSLKDCFGFRDLINDFKLTYYGDYYKNYKQFDSVDAMVAHPDSRGRMSRIHQGLRYHYDGKHKHWLPDNTGNLAVSSSSPIIQSTSEIHALDNTSLYSNNTSMRAIYPSSPKLQFQSSSPPNSPVISKSIPISEQQQTIEDIISTDPELSNIDYSQEFFNQDEEIYQVVIKEVGNYKLDQVEIKKLLNYPIVDEVIDSHVYGYKVKKLRQRQKLRDQYRKGDNGERMEIQGSGSNESYRYGSIV
ncbi:Transmembrane protein [Spathaspora sp. JA1]|nr:Transmembrane protein [Spathaspora sp. JA1]